MERANIKVSRDLFEELRNDKPEDTTWDAYLRSQCLDTTDEPSIRDVLERVDSIPQEAANEIERRLR